MYVFVVSVCIVKLVGGNGNNTTTTSWIADWFENFETVYKIYLHDSEYMSVCILVLIDPSFLSYLSYRDGSYKVCRSKSCLSLEKCKSKHGTNNGERESKVK